MERKDALVLPNVRCVTCGKVVGGIYSRFAEMIKSGMSPEDAFEKLGIRRYCCRMTLMNPLVIPAGYQVQTESQIGEYFNALTTQTLEAQKKSRKISLPYTPEPPDPKDIPTTRNYTAN